MLGSGPVTDNGMLIFDRTDTYGGSVSNVIGGSGAVTLSAGTLTLSGANTYNGNTLVSAGTLALANNLALQNSAVDTSGAAPYYLERHHTDLRRPDKWRGGAEPRNLVHNRLRQREWNYSESRSRRYRQLFRRYCKWSLGHDTHKDRSGHTNSHRRQYIQQRSDQHSRGYVDGWRRRCVGQHQQNYRKQRRHSILLAASNTVNTTAPVTLSGGTIQRNGVGVLEGTGATVTAGTPSGTTTQGLGHSRSRLPRLWTLARRAPAPWSSELSIQQIMAPAFSR